MANYRTHVTFGAITGACATGIGLAIAPEPHWPHLLLGGFFGFLGGMIPDLDHDKGHALQTIMALMSTILPVIFVAIWTGGKGNWTLWSLLFLLPTHYALHWALPQLSFFSPKGRSAWRTSLLAIVVASICAVPSVFFFKDLPLPLPQTLGLMVAIAVAVQLIIPPFKKVTVHRGVWHSIPVVFIFAELIFIFLYNFPMTERLILGAAAFAGCLSHLILDEIYSVDFNGLRIKRSFGTALKLWDKKYPMTSTFAYGLMIVLGIACFVI